MDGLPKDALARIFSHLPTLDLGRIMSVSCSWNTLLSTSSKLWIKVNLSERPPGKSISKALQILEVFSNRCQSTLETIILPPSSLNDPEIAKMIQLLESSRATLRKLVFFPFYCSIPMMEFINFVSRCPQLEELDLTGNDRGFEQVETSPGVLTHCSCLDLNAISENHLDLLRNLRVLQVMGYGGSLFLKVLSHCAGTLQYFRSGGKVKQSEQEDFQRTVSNTLHHLKILRIEESYGTWSKEWDLSALQNLEELGINPGKHSSLAPFKTPVKLDLSVPSFTGEGKDDRLEILQTMIKILDSSQANIGALSLSTLWEDPANHSIDQVL